MNKVGEHAVVIGASVGGLVCAPVLAEAFERVTVIERDELPEPGAGRRAVPQGKHAHALLAAGLDNIEELFPGFAADAISAGSPTYRPGIDWRFSAGGHQLANAEAGRTSLVASRPLIEGQLRRRVLELPNVEVREHCDVLGLVADGGGAVRGVKTLRRAPGSAEEIVPADLVVAASGRAARVPAWLEAMGFPRPVEERVGVDILYRSTQLRLRNGGLGTDKLVLVGPRPGHPRGMAIFAQEEGRWLLTLYGYGAAHHPPAETDDYLAFASTVAPPDVFEAIRTAERLGEVASHRFPASLRRRYDRLGRFPQGLLVTGDAISSFNPIYGQGMTVASFEALALRRSLRRGRRRLAQRFFRASRPPVDRAWQLSVGADLALPEVDAHRPLGVRVINAYIERLQAAAEHDPEVARAFIAVAGMLAPPPSLMRPRIAARVLVGQRARQRRNVGIPPISSRPSPAQDGPAN